MNDDALLNISVRGELWPGADEDALWAGNVEIDYPDVGKVGMHLKAAVDGETEDEALIASFFCDPLTARALAAQLNRQADQSDPMTDHR